MRKRASIRLVKGEVWLERLPHKDAQLTTDMFDAWRARREALRHTEKSINRDLSSIKDFVMFSGLPPWSWTEEHFELWGAHLAKERNLRAGTQRIYQAAVRLFLDYIIRNSRFNIEVQKAYGTTLRQVVTPENSLVHRLEDESPGGTPAMTVDQVEQFFGAIDTTLAIYWKNNHPGRYPLARDKAVFSFMYVTAARISEATGLVTSSFDRHPKFPKFGRFGRVSLWGKGSKGSGPRLRTIPIDNPTLPPVLEWYEEEIYPYFQVRMDPNDTYFFPSSQGNQVSLSNLEKRFQMILEWAGLEGMDFVPHSLRGTSATHGSMMHGNPLAQQHKLGHSFLSTTEGYADYPDPFIRNQVDAATRRQIDRYNEDDDDTEV